MSDFTEFNYALHTPEDGFRSAASVATRVELIRRNLESVE